MYNIYFRNGKTRGNETVGIGKGYSSECLTWKQWDRVGFPFVFQRLVFSTRYNPIKIQSFCFEVWSFLCLSFLILFNLFLEALGTDFFLFPLKFVRFDCVWRNEPFFIRYNFWVLPFLKLFIVCFWIGFLILWVI